MGECANTVRPSRRHFVAPQDEGMCAIAALDIPHAEEALQRRLEARTIFVQVDIP